MDAKEIIMMEYGGSRNFITPSIIRYGMITEENRKGFSEIAYELSVRGSSNGGTLYGLTVVSYDPKTRKTNRERELSTCFYSLIHIENYIKELEMRWETGHEGP